jgi:nucleotide-binding universal stress UspA family protein
MRSVSSILLPVDFSERSAPAARYARSLAAQFQSQLILLHVLPPLHLEFGGADISGYMVTELCENRVQQATQELASFLPAEFADDASIERLVLEGDPARCIVETAHERAGVILMPTHGYGPFRRFILGSVTAKVLHDADCPVWTGVHLENAPTATVPLRRIVCAVDLGAQSSKALCWAASLAAQFGAQLTLLHVTLGAPEAAHDELERLRSFVHAEAEVRVIAGDPPAAICAAAEGADLLAIGRGSAAGVFGRLRANAYSIIRQSPCPVVSI